MYTYIYSYAHTHVPYVIQILNKVWCAHATHIHTFTHILYIYMFALANTHVAHFMLTITKAWCHYTQHTHIFTHILYIYIHTHTHVVHFMLQCGEDSQDALSCRSFFAKEPLIIGLFCGK